MLGHIKTFIENLFLCVQLLISVGHGQSEGERAHVLSFSDYVQDVLLHVDQVKNKFPDTPIFLVGHSMVS